MNIVELFLLAVSLSMDAFAVSISNGLVMPCVKKRYAAVFGLYFGFFQFIMPLIGYALSVHFSLLIKNFDHWIAFALLVAIGGNMIKESFSKEEDSAPDVLKILCPKNMLLLAVATSIDALAVGVSFACLQNTNIIFSCAVIGIVTFSFSFCGLLLGKKAGSYLKQYATRTGGIILTAIGIKILVQHLFFGA